MGYRNSFKGKIVPFVHFKLHEIFTSVINLLENNGIRNAEGRNTETGHGAIQR